MFRERDKDDNTLFKFENVSEFKRYLDKNSDSENQDTLKKVESTSYGEPWSGVAKWKDFENYLEEGNSELTDEIKNHTKLYIKQFEKLYAEKSDYMFDVTGQFFDIGAVMLGEPEAWLKEIQVKEDKFIEIDINGSYLGSADVEAVKRNGSKLLAIGVVLEEQGYLVRMNMRFRSEGVHTRKSKCTCEVNIPIKDYNQPLDYKKMGILLGVPFFRRGIFRLREIEYGKDLDSGYGRSLPKKDDIQLDETRDVAKLEAKLRNKEEI